MHSGCRFFLAKEFHSEIILIHVVPEIKDYPMGRNKIRKLGTFLMNDVGVRK